MPDIVFFLSQRLPRLHVLVHNLHHHLLQHITAHGTHSAKHKHLILVLVHMILPLVTFSWFNYCILCTVIIANNADNARTRKQRHREINIYSYLKLSFVDGNKPVNVSLDRYLVRGRCWVRVPGRTPWCGHNAYLVALRTLYLILLLYQVD